jgi:predicted lipid-binding transport protein (Tim44 family)
MYQAFQGDWDGVLTSLKAGFNSLLDVITGLWNALGGVGATVGALGGWAMKLFGSNPTNAAANIQNGPGSQVAPVGPAAMAGNQSNQHVQQQTQINVQAGPNAGATAAAVVGAQNSVNRDMVRNLKGATR